ncbi:MAG: hypothetical protein SF070_08700 [Gemmatimonadota bacterium]|nr:hypothetical protein [Gemmatimonadota bacterium]
MLKSLSITAALSALLLSGVRAQAPGADIARVALGKDSLAVWFSQGGPERQIGRAWDELALVAGPPSRLWRVYRMENELFGPLLDTVVFELPSLRTFSRRTIGYLNSDSLFLVGDTVRGWQQRRNEPREPVALYLPPGTIDANAFDLAIRATDWAPGVTREWQAYLPGQRSFLRMGARYEGVEMVRQRDGREIECWRILGDYAGSPVTFWIDPRDRGMVKQSIGLSRGAVMVLAR